MKTLLVFFLWFISNVLSDDSNITEDMICENAADNTVRLSCNDSKVIHILSALYGRKERDPGSCSCDTDINLCHVCDTNCGNITDSTRRVKDECQGQQFCNFTANNDFFGDPCNDTCKYVQLAYQCVIKLATDEKEEINSVQYSQQQSVSSYRSQEQTTESFDNKNFSSVGPPIPPIPIIAGVVSSVVILILICIIGSILVWQRRRNKNREQAEENEINQINIISQTNGHGSVHVYENNVQMESLPEQNVYNSLHIDQKIDHEYECMKK